MPEFLVELYVSSTNAAAVQLAVERARRGAAAVSPDGGAVRCLRAIFVPEDETCLLLYEADSAGAVHDAATRAGLPCDRIVAAFAESEATP